MHRKNLLVMNILIIFVFLLSSCAVQQTADLPTAEDLGVEQLGEITYEDILQMDWLNKFELLSDGKYVVYMKSTGTDLAPPQNNGVLVLLGIETRTERALTDPSESVVYWQLAPDGVKLAYLSMDKATLNKELHMLDTSTRNSTLIRDVPEELLAGFKWLSNDKLLFLGADPRKPQYKLPGNVVIMDEIPDPVILKSYSLADGSVDLLTNNSDVVYEYEASPDGKYILYKASTYPEVWLETPKFRYAMLDVATKTEEEVMVMEEGFEDENEFVWAADGQRVYIERMQNGGLHYPVRYTSDIIYYEIASKEIKEVPLQWERKLLKDLFNDDIEITPFEDGVYALLADGANPKLARYTETDSGWKMDVLQGQHQGNIFALESSPDGRTLYYNASTATMPMQIYEGEVQDTAINNVTRLSNLNKHLTVKDLGTSEVVSWGGVNGEPVQAVLRYPPGYQADKPTPAVFVIHGGPTYTDFDGWRDTWEFPYHLISNLGVVLVSANYHGSSNFGFEFTQSIEGGHYFEYPIEDFMKGVQFLAGEGIIDPERIGITGWSNGGILPLYWITQDASLKAAVAGAGSADEYGQIAYINGMVMNLMYQNKPPFEDPEAYISMLGLYQAENIKTPLLMFNGTVDQAVVPAGAMTTYRAYKRGSQAEVKQILFPDEPHHLGHYENQLRKVMEEINWLAKILE